ncbi:hypothetical protein BM525_21640 (plasmid) [Alteromonas mediterranea]|uniref:Uncharacterized protein n=1 Tax=Alteromonas mediterranea TaxID=314275 RepID=A0AAC9JGY1_9ALTE|nr:hypothetical protein [Alteromonas mediterranea]APD92465.1 hypothetical protein BM524_21420 [Alteromonas mediterranea]APE00326.1 hypothetical protein BM525_21640 [Alteromonas mediterranea]
MDINVYLKSAFQIYPTMYRDFSVYLMKDEVRNAILNPKVDSRCPQCGSQTTLVETVNPKQKKMYRIECSRCESNSGEFQDSIAKAVWSAHRKKGSSFSCVPPTILPNTYDVLQKRAAKTSLEDVSIKWLASVNFVDKAWKVQAKTGDYKALLENDKNYVDTITLVLGVIKRQAVESVVESGLNINDEKVKHSLALEHANIIEERRLYYPRYKNSLTKTMAHKVTDLLR